MNEKQKHLGEEIQDFLDNRLSLDEKSRAEEHFGECEKCRAELEALRWTKHVARNHTSHAGAPDELRKKILNSLDQQHAKVTQAAVIRRRNLILVAAAALAIAIVAGIIYRASRPVSLPELISQDYRSFESGQLKLQKETADVHSMESFFKAGGIPFQTRVFDLAMMNYDLLGGSVHRLNGRASALFVYKGPQGSKMVCQMYPGSLNELPPPVEVRDNKGIKFFIYRSQSITMVFWQEGNIICALSSSAASEEVIQLAFAKAVKI